MTVQMLLSLGYRVNSAESTKQARQELMNGTSPDLLLSDVMLPGGRSGVEFAADIKTEWPDLPILLMTGYGPGIAESVDQKSGAGRSISLLQKPFTITELGDAIAECLKPRRAT